MVVNVINLTVIGCKCGTINANGSIISSNDVRTDCAIYYTVGNYKYARSIVFMHYSIISKRAAGDS